MRRSHLEENQLKIKHSALLAIRSGSITKTRKYLNSKHAVDFVAHPHSSVPWHAVFMFVISVLLGVLQLHCKASPFETHLPNMMVFLFAILIYCFAYYFNNISSQIKPTNLTIPFEVSAHLALFFGSLASASLISVLIPTH